MTRSTAELTLNQHRTAGLKPAWQAGQSGNPKGRPTGARHKLSQSFIDAIYDEFQAHGADAIRQLREESPGEFLRLVAGLIPKKVTLDNKETLPTVVLDFRGTVASRQEPLVVDGYSE
jgi:hypothetical protein